MPTKLRYALGANLWIVTLPIRVLRLIIHAKNSVDWEDERQDILGKFALVGEASVLAMRTNIKTNER